MKVALVHDWLIHMRGGEKVLESFAEVFPDATIYTLFSNRKRLSPSLQRMKIKNSVLQYFPGIRNYYPWLLPLLPFFIRTQRIEPADVVISSSHCVAKGIKIPKGTFHICYCHTPMRYLWGFESEYFGKFPPWLLGLLQPIFGWLRRWDVATSKNVNHFLCNSETVRDRIQKIYGREARVIHPPVDAGFFQPNSTDDKEKKDFYLVVSALTPYKRVEVAVEAFNNWNRELVIVGDGPSRLACERRAQTSNIRFVGKVPDETLRDLYRQARALIFPQEEDFGIVPLEAQGCGTPVIAYARGGALESVKNGIFFEEETPEAIRQAILKFESKKFDSRMLREGVLGFDKPRFKHKIRQAVQDALQEKPLVAGLAHLDG